MITSLGAFLELKPRFDLEGRRFDGLGRKWRRRREVEEVRLGR